jgi:hypothetical protein
MKRLPTVALGVALCALAAPAAEARQMDFPRASSDSLYSIDDHKPYAYPRSSRRTARSTDRRRAGKRWQPRAKTARRSVHRGARTGRRHVARTGRRHGLHARSFMRYARGGVSRTCLTPAARALLGRIEAQFGRVQVISTCRPGARIAGTGRPSRHASGNAIDFNAPRGRKAQVVRWLIANHRSGGTMTYAGMGHIHVDIGPRFVSLNAGARWR